MHRMLDTLAFYSAVGCEAGLESVRKTELHTV